MNSLTWLTPHATYGPFLLPFVTLRTLTWHVIQNTSRSPVIASPILKVLPLYSSAPVACLSNPSEYVYVCWENTDLLPEGNPAPSKVDLVPAEWFTPSIHEPQSTPLCTHTPLPNLPLHPPKQLPEEPAYVTYDSNVSGKKMHDFATNPEIHLKSHRPVRELTNDLIRRVCHFQMESLKIWLIKTALAIKVNSRDKGEGVVLLFPHNNIQKAGEKRVFFALRHEYCMWNVCL